jgi:hypothetical protein
LVTDSALVRDIYNTIIGHEKEHGSRIAFGRKLIRESAEVCADIADILRLNSSTTQVETLHVSGTNSFAEQVALWSRAYGRLCLQQEASIEALSFISPKGQEKTPVALHVGRLRQLFSTGKQALLAEKDKMRRIGRGGEGYDRDRADFHWESEWDRSDYASRHVTVRYVPGDNIYLSPGLSNPHYIEPDYVHDPNPCNYLFTVPGREDVSPVVPLVGEKIDQNPGVIGHIDFKYKGAGTRPETLNTFLKANPTMFSDESTIRRWYG